MIMKSPGSHRVEGEQPFAIIASGHDSDVSFGYAGGSGIGVISVPPPSALPLTAAITGL